jgi:hypothetical protein
MERYCRNCIKKRLTADWYKLNKLASHLIKQVILPWRLMISKVICILSSKLVFTCRTLKLERIERQPYLKQEQKSHNCCTSYD